MGGADNTQPVHRINMPVAGYGGQSSGTAREGGPGPWLSARPPLNSAPSSSQEKNQRATHLTGAFLAFFVGILYFWLQASGGWAGRRGTGCIARIWPEYPECYQEKPHVPS